jgi:hypothetical protein
MDHRVNCVPGAIDKGFYLTPGHQEKSLWGPERRSPKAQGHHNVKYGQHQRGLPMLEGKKEMIPDAFMQLKNSQLDMKYDFSINW